LGQKYYETKLIGMFIRAAKGMHLRFASCISDLDRCFAISDLTKLDRINSSTAYTTNKLISATEMRNPDTKAAFYVTRHATSSDETKDSFKLYVSTSRGNLTVPATNGTNIVLNGRDSKIVVVSYAF
jgi:hypothetical protein